MSAVGRRLASPGARRPARVRVARMSVAAVAGSAALVLGLASPAAAHDYVVDSTPAEGATVTELPEAWVVTANAPLLALEGNDAAFAIVVTDAEGLYYGDGCVTVAGPTMSAPAVLGAPGEYAMTYQYVSSDGHTLSDTYDFTYEPTGDEPVTAGTMSAPECSSDADSTADAATSGTGSATGDEGTAVLAGVTWIGGGLLAAAAITTIVVLATRRRPARD